MKTNPKRSKLTIAAVAALFALAISGFYAGHTLRLGASWQDVRIVNHR